MTGVSTVSFMKELEELAAKLSQVGEAPAAGPTKLVDHHHWQLVVDNLKDAHEHFEDAARALREAAAPSGVPGESPLESPDRTTQPGRARVLAEVAVDLARESQDLRRRAEVRRRLAHDEPQPQPTGPAASGKVAAHPAKTVAPEKDQPATPKPEHHVDKAPERGIRAGATALDDAQAALTRAIEHASTGSGDTAAAAFVEDLDVLEEMTLGLRRRVDEISEVRVD